MEALHRQVLPFLLRRMKDDVLQDLPPKIIQDYYCNLSPLQVWHVYPHTFTEFLNHILWVERCALKCWLWNGLCYKMLQLIHFNKWQNHMLYLISPVPVQVQLYEDFAKSRAKVNVDDVISTSSAPEEEEKPKHKATGHVFQVWCYESYLRIWRCCCQTGHVCDGGSGRFRLCSIWGSCVITQRWYWPLNTRSTSTSQNSCPANTPASETSSTLPNCLRLNRSVLNLFLNNMHIADVNSCPVDAKQFIYEVWLSCVRCCSSCWTVGWVLQEHLMVAQRLWWPSTVFSSSVSWRACWTLWSKICWNHSCPPSPTSDWTEAFRPATDTP